MPNCGSLSLVLATEIDWKNSFKFHWTSWHIQFYEDIETATLCAVTYILLVLCLPVTYPSACGLQDLLPSWTQNTVFELILQLGLKYTELCIHCQFILIIINSKMCANVCPLTALYVYDWGLCLQVLPLKSSTSFLITRVLIALGWFAQHDHWNVLFFSFFML